MQFPHCLYEPQEVVTMPTNGLANHGKFIKSTRRAKDARAMATEHYELHRKNPSSDILLTCDHATNRIPDWVQGGTLGLSRHDMECHFAYDVGAAGVTRHLSDALGASAILSDFSRLVVDPNRGENDPTLIPAISDGRVVPGNIALEPGDRARRFERCYHPYHAALAALLDDIPVTVIVAIHTFTPKMRDGPKRPWHIGILSGKDRRLGGAILAELDSCEGLVIGDNKPYSGHLPGDSIDRHALSRGLPGVLVEFRNDLVSTESDQAKWARFFAPLLKRAVTSATRKSG